MTDTRRKHVGADAILAQKEELLSEYDKLIAMSKDDPVKVDAGVGAEAVFRKWLGQFLPKRFGVTKGYIITSNLEYDGPLEEWDIIIFDQNESPVLFVKDNYDQSETGKRRAIPVEHVRAVIEVKSTLTPANAEKVTDKLLKLSNFMGVETSPRYPRFLSQTFFCSTIFFETRLRDTNDYQNALDKLIPLHQSGCPWIGALTLRSQTEPDLSGHITAISSDAPFDFPPERSSQFQFPGGKYGRLHCQWGINTGFPTFIFKLLNYLKADFSNLAPSFYGMDYGNPKGAYLFYKFDKK